MSPQLREYHVVPILLESLRKFLRRSWPPAFLAPHDDQRMRPQEDFQCAPLVAAQINVGRDLQPSLTGQVADLALQEFHRHRRLCQGQCVRHFIGHEQPNVRLQILRQPSAICKAARVPGASVKITKTSSLFSAMPVNRIVALDVMRENRGGETVLIT